MDSDSDTEKANNSFSRFIMLEFTNQTVNLCDGGVIKDILKNKK